MDFLKGYSRVLYIKDDGEFKPVGCLTSNPLSEGSEMIKTTTAESGGWRTSRPTNQFFSISFEGMQILTGTGYDETMLSYDTLKEKKRAKELLEWKIENVSGSLSDAGSGYITEIGESNAVGDFLTFNGVIEGFGQPVFSRGSADYWQNGNEMLFQDGAEMLFQIN